MSTHRLLMIEDDARLAAMVGEYLTQSGYAVTHRGDGETGLQTLQGEPFDLVVLDLMLPGIDGLEVCRRIRALPDGDRVAILAMTANAFAEDRRRCLDAGMDDFLAKPVEPEELYATLLSVLKRGKNSG